MRAPLSWLRDWVELQAEATPQNVLDAFVRVGLEDEEILRFDVSGPVVVGQVLERVPEPQNNGKTINWCQVRVAPEGQTAADGGADVRGIVCGAHNFDVGDKVVVTLPGSVLPGGFAIAARKTYGHISDGMIASVRELGIGEDHDGILVLSTLGLDPEIGTSAITLLGLDEEAVDVNVTPDRGYALSMRGLAREYSHATGAAFQDPATRRELATLAEQAIAPDAASIRVPVTVSGELAVRDQAMCPVFAAFVVEGADPTRRTPQWMRTRLELAGIRSKSLLIDITNYVCLELGQPIHGYDLAKLDGGLVVRRAEAGERITTLDGKDRELSTEDIVIADNRGPIGIAGVMGGAETEISATTTELLIEAANFAPISIARSARRHKLPSEASRRFERGVDPRVAVAAAARVAELAIELAGARLVPAGVVVGEAPALRTLTLRAQAAAERMGIAYSRQEIVDSLTAIGAVVDDSDADTFTVTVPSWRPDLVDEVSLVEEIGRLGDFDRIPSVLPVAPSGRGLTREQTLRRQLANALAASGSVEVLSYPFTTLVDNTLFGDPSGNADQHVKLANALDSETAWLRRSMLPGLVGVAHRNVSRGMTDLSIFEIGHVFLPRQGHELGVDELPPVAARPSDEALQALELGLPEQPRFLGALLVGDRVAKGPGQAAVSYDWADALELARVAAHAAAAELIVKQGSHRAFHPGRAAELFVRLGHDLVSVGFAGELHPEVSAERDLPGRVCAVELNLDLLLEAARREVVPGLIAGYPAATQDLSLVMKANIPAADVKASIVEGAGELLESIVLVDDYRGAGIDNDEKSLTFALRFRAGDRTLTAAEASEAKEAGAHLAKERFGATMRV